MNNDMSERQQPPSDKSDEGEAFSDDEFGELQSAQPRKLQLLRLGTTMLGVFEDEIAAIAEWRHPTPLPHAPPAVLGVVSIQGRILTVLDPSVLLNETENQNGISWSLIVALRGDEQLGLAVEAAIDTLETQLSDLTPPPATASPAVIGAITHGAQLVNVIEVKELFPIAFRGRERRRRSF